MTQNLGRFVVIFLVCLLIRIPYLLGEHLFFDGDEAVLGIMARDLLAGESFPVFFYGQQYGFSLLEAASAALWIPFFGQTVWSLKLGGILIFSLGIYEILEITRQKQVSFLYQGLILLFLSSYSPWILWATKLRGGYLTAFWLFCFVLKILFTNENLLENAFWKLGVLIPLIYFSQPLFLLPLFPILGFKTLKSLTVKSVLSGLVTTITTFGILKYFALQNPDYWRPTVFSNSNLIHLKTFFVTNFWSYYSGNYLYIDAFPVNSFFQMLLLLSISTTGLALCILVYRTRMDFLKNYFTVIIGLLLSAFSIIFFDLVNGRYTLPFFTLLLISFVLVFLELKNYYLKTATILLCSIVFFQLTSIFQYNKSITSYWLSPIVNDLQTLQELMNELEKRDLKYLYTTDWFLMWQINYLGNEKIHCRHKSISDRLDRYAKNVNQCAKNKECKLALVGSHIPLLNMDKHPKWTELVEKINDRYYILENPPEDLLKIGEYE